MKKYYRGRDKNYRVPNVYIFFCAVFYFPKRFITFVCWKYI